MRAFNVSTRTRNITHVHTVTSTCPCFVWGLVENRGGLYTRMSFQGGKTGLAQKGTFNVLNSSIVKHETFLKALLILGRNLQTFYALCDSYS